MSKRRKKLDGMAGGESADTSNWNGTECRSGR